MNFDIKKTPDAAVTPETHVAQKFEFQGGAIASLFTGDYLASDYNGNTGTVDGNAKKPAPMLALFDYFRYRDDDGNDSVWTATIPVYKDENEAPSCMNANKSLEIVGYAKIKIYSPNPPPDTNLLVKVDCNISMIERSGGGNLGNILGTIPALVK